MKYDLKGLLSIDIDKLIDDYVLNEKARMILRRHFIDGVGFSPLAHEFNMSERGIKYIVYKWGDKIFNKNKPGA